MTYFDYIFNMKCGVFKPHKSQASLFYYLFHMKSAMWAKKTPQMMHFPPTHKDTDRPWQGGIEPIAVTTF